MPPVLRNILAVIAGWAIGSIVNMGIIIVGSKIIAAPEGVDPADIESVKANIDSFEAKHFISPWLAHALGTLVGAFIAARLAATRHMTMALIVGGIFMLGGIAVAAMTGGPIAFTILDLAAYLPAAWLGGSIAGKALAKKAGA